MTNTDSDKPDKGVTTRGREREDATLLYDAAAMVALQKISDYLDRNLEVFRDPARAPTVAIPLRDYGSVDGLQPRSHRLRHAVRDTNIELKLSFDYERDGNARFTIPRPLVTESELAAQFRRDGLTLVSSRVRGAEADRQELLFELRGRIPASISFEADSENGVLRLELINIGAVGRERYLVKPEQVDAEFLHQLGRFVMHRRNAFLQETMLVTQGYPLAAEREAEEADDAPDTVSLLPAADVIDFDPITFTGKREIVLSYRDMTLSFDRYRSECLFGRKFPADIQVRSRYVSRAHATLRFVKNQFVFEDHSANGTFVRIEGKGVRFLHHESMRLRRSGVISLGVSVTSEKRDLIFFEVS